MKLRGEWFWADRWVASSGGRLPCEARGIYREMLTVAWLEGAKLPNDPAQIQLMCRVRADEWERSWPLVQPFWRVDGGSLVNDNQLEVYAASQGLSDKRSAAGRKGNAARWGNGAAVETATPAKQPEKPRQVKAWKFSNLYVSPKMHKIVCDALGRRSAGFDFDRFYGRCALEYLERGQPVDVLADLKRRAIAGSVADLGPTIEDSEARRARERASAPSAEERAKIREMFKGSR